MNYLGPFEYLTISIQIPTVSGFFSIHYSDKRINLQEEPCLSFHTGLINKTLISYLKLSDMYTLVGS